MCHKQKIKLSAYTKLQVLIDLKYQKQLKFTFNYSCYYRNNVKRGA